MPGLHRGLAAQRLERPVPEHRAPLREHVEGTHQDSVGWRRIASGGPYDLERYFRDLKTAGRSEASVRQARAVLHRSCRLASKWSSGALPNPINRDLASRVVPSPSRRPRCARPAWRRFSACSSPQRMATLACPSYGRLVAATSLRRCEACALRWVGTVCLAYPRWRLRTPCLPYRLVLDLLQQRRRAESGFQMPRSTARRWDRSVPGSQGSVDSG